MAYIGPAPKLGQNREVDDISSGFNGSTTAFTLQVSGSNVSPGSANSIIVSVNNVIQNPNTDYTINGSTITFTSAPTNGQAFFAVVLNQGVDTSAPADGSITTVKLGDDAVTYAKIQNVSATDRLLGRDSSGAGVIEEIAPSAVRTMLGLATSATTDTTNASNISSGTLAAARVADLAASKITSGTIDTARLGSGTASSSTFLRGDSTFATVTSTTINNNADNRIITGSGTANTLEAETNFSFDGSTLSLTGQFNINASAASVQGVVMQNATSNSNADFRLSIKTAANQGADPYIFFDSGGSNMVVGQRYAGTTNNKLVLGAGNDPSSVAGLEIDGNGQITPDSNNARDLGSSSLRFRDIFTNDLNLSNEGGVNDIDGTWGSYTIQEGAEDLFLINKRNGKKYKFNLTEVS